MEKKDQLQQPFFAKLLELQRTMQGPEAIHPITLKILDDIEHTLKYPSDGDEF
jgi:hypothetical protein